MKKVKLGDIGKIVTGKTPSTKNPAFFEIDFMFITPEDITNNPSNIIESKRYISKLGINSILSNSIDGVSVVVGCIGSDMGNIGYVKGKCATNQQLNSITNIQKNYDAKFIYYCLKPQKEHLRKIAGSTTTPILPKSVFEEIEISIPDLQTQSAIARVLSSFDDKIELNNKINRELENLARTIYEYWFVQNAEESWERKKIGDLIENQKSGDWGKETEEGNYTQKVTCIRGADINSLVGSGELKAPKRYILEKNKCKFLCDGDFIIEISGGSPTQSTGRIAYILEEMLKGFENPLICSNFCKAISLKNKGLFYYFVFIWRQLYDNGLFFGYEGKTSGIKNFLFDDFVSFFEIVIPPTQILKKFNKTVSSIFEQIIKNRQENAELAQLRDFLLPLLMNGQVTVSKTQDEPTIIPFKKFANDDAKYQTWNTEIGLAARCDIDEQTLRNIYEAIDENDR